MLTQKPPKDLVGCARSKSHGVATAMPASLPTTCQEPV